LRRRWISDGLILFRECEVTETLQLELSRVFGPLGLHPTGEFLSKEAP
jgi:hypothetical protein